MLDQMNVDSPQVPPLNSWELRDSLSAPMVLHLLRRGRTRILVSGAVAFLLAILFALLLPLKYTATASFVPPGPDNDSGAAALLGQIVSGGGVGGMLERKSRGDLYIAVLKSHTVAQEMLHRFDLMRVYRLKKETPAEQVLASRSLFTAGQRDPIVTIEVTDENPVFARDLAEGYIETLQKVSAELALSESSQRRLFFEQRLAREKDLLANAEVELKQLEEKTGLVAPAGQTATNIQALAQVQAQITTEQAQLAALRQSETDQNPDVLRLKSEIASLQGKAAEMESGAEKGFGRLSTAQVPELQLEYIRKSRDVRYHETLFDIIAKQYEAARLDEAKDAPLQVLDRPTVPDVKSGPPRTIIVLVGLMLGLVGGTVWVLLKGLRTV